MSIQVSNVTKLYGKQKALDDVSFEVSPGEVVGFLGPNGAGKTTMMKIITCFISQTMGEVSVCGFDVVEQSLEVKKYVGYLPENNPLYHDMYVKEYLAFVAGLYKIKKIKSRVAGMIETTGLQIEQKKKIGALSKGYRQRVGLAQALIHEPKVLILDEPTSGLDPIQLSEIRDLIKEIGKERTVMLSTHIMQEVEAVCDRAIIIHKGRIVADDTVSHLQEQTGKKQVITVEFSGSITREELMNIDKVTDVKNIDGNTWKISAHPDKDIRYEISQLANSRNLLVLTMQKEEQRLEEVFRKLTK
ncbi:MAG: gliding motility-associated ABC transporter ATP-binding subunit GldA [Bacteroidota bacterium]